MREPTEQEIRNYSMEDYKMPTEQHWLVNYVFITAILILLAALVIE